MSRKDYPHTIVIFCFLLNCLFFCREAAGGAAINFTVPKNYDPTSTLYKARYKEGDIIVRFAPKANGNQQTDTERNAILSTLGGGEVEHSFKLVPGLSVVKLPKGTRVKDVLTNFNKAQGILYAQPNYILKAFSTFPNDTYFPQLWGMNNTGLNGGSADADIDAPEAWDIETDASQIIVAVIDTGVDYTHPDLAANMWTDANGHYGYDFVNDDDDPMDDHGHGTHCAGIIGAKGNNGIGVMGVCWNVKIMALKFLDYTGGGDTSDAIECIEYAIDNGAKVLSNSWGSYENNPALLNEIEVANANGVLFIAAAGNDGMDNDEYPAYPASYDCNNIISVMATNNTDEQASYSNYGATKVDLAAPGGEGYQNPGAILSTFPTYQTPGMDYLCAYYWICFSTNYESIDGTSMAAPHVAGACALVWSMNRTLNPLQIKDIILNSVDKLPSLDGRCVTEGRLNLYNAVSNTPLLSPALTLYKVDDVPDGNYVSGGDYVTYTISYDYNCPGMCPDINNAVLVDRLPQPIDPFDIYASNGGVYDMDSRTVTWNLGTLSAGDSNCFTLMVRIAEAYESWSMATNVCLLKSGTTIHSIATEQTQLGRVRNMTQGIWYDFIQDAIDDANSGDTIQVWPGTYVEDIRIVDKSIILRSTEPNDRDVAASTIIYGEHYDSGPVISLENTTGSIVSGFTITHGYYGIDYVLSSAEISCCIVENNKTTGIKCTDSNPTITHTIVENNGNGIVVFGGDLYIAYCLIGYNDGGIYLTEPGTATIINNWIHNNYDCGIFFNSDYQVLPIIRNNTIFGNLFCGIWFNWWDSDAIIHNCIIRGNTGGDLGGDGTFNNVNYCCLQSEHSGEENFVADPRFYNAGANDYHLTYNSPCKNAGDHEGSYGDETDIDGEPRIKYGQVDIGADEYYRSPDFDKNGIVDFKDFAVLALTWLKGAGDGGFNEICDLADDDIIDVGDLELFCQDWLLQTGEEQGLMLGGAGGEVGLLKVADTALSEQGAEAEQIVLTEADVKEILRWTDASELEAAEVGLEEYKIFRQSLEKELLDMLKSSNDEK